MTPEQVRLVQDSFALVARISDAAAEIFYERLFAVAPQVRGLFPDDMTEQQRKLMATLAVVVNGLGNLDALLPAASALAKRHVDYGAQPAHYPVVGETLMWTLARGLGPAWTPEVAAAWSAAYGALADFMIREAYAAWKRPNSALPNFSHCTILSQPAMRFGTPARPVRPLRVPWRTTKLLTLNSFLRISQSGTKLE